MCLFANRLERGRFIWPSPADGTVTISSPQLGYLLKGIDWGPSTARRDAPIPFPRVSVSVLTRGPMRLLAMQMPCRLFRSAWHLF